MEIPDFVLAPKGRTAMLRGLQLAKKGGETHTSWSISLSSPWPLWPWVSALAPASRLRLRPRLPTVTPS